MSATSCQEILRKQFNNYDKSVDIISCWESFFDEFYQDEFSNYHFERFPSIDVSGQDNPLTPDFTVFFNDQYGMIGEVKRGFGDDDEAFSSDLEQVMNYDRSLPLDTASGGSQIPSTCDILLLISGTAAPQIGTRISRHLEEVDYNVTNNLVLTRYQFNQYETLSRYEFQRVTELGYEFRDDALPDDLQLSTEIGEAGDYGTLLVYPKHFGPVKIKSPLCNDDPPGQYLATILWNKIFPLYIDYGAHPSWKGKSTLPIEVMSVELTDWINRRYLRHGRVRQQWVTGALDFLCGADLAEELDESYEIGYRDLVIDVSDSISFQEGLTEYREVKELAYMLINRYCKYTEDSDVPPPEQSSIHEF